MAVNKREETTAKKLCSQRALKHKRQTGKVGYSPEQPKKTLKAKLKAGLTGEPCKEKKNWLNSYKFQHNSHSNRFKQLYEIPLEDRGEEAEEFRTFQ